jgi:HD-GYP domain-containing protein (c-di-GMP phosphodiesterase class II)/pSer/pThr/pTyr-binding forkhead associated (FHA) protein
MAFLRAKNGPHRGRAFEVAAKPVTIGRDDSQTVRVLDEGVSRAHAEVFRMGASCFVRDLNSTNGTYLNGVKVTEEQLKAGDEMVVGNTTFVFDVSLVEAEELGAIEYEDEAHQVSRPSTIELHVDPASLPTDASTTAATAVRSRNVSLIGQVGRTLSEERDLARAFEKVLEIVCQGIGARLGYFFELRPEAAEVTPRASVDLDGTSGQKKISRTLIRRVADTCRSILTTNAAMDGRFALSESVILRQIRSVICVPVLVDQRVEGVLYFHSNRDRSLNVEDLELATSVALQVAMALAGAGATERLREGLMATIRSLVAAMEAVEPKDQGHARRVADLSVALATRMSLPGEEIQKLRLAALVHDVGKLAVQQASAGVPVERLKEQHVYAGEKILAGVEGFEDLLPCVRFHHERADGSGYPYKVKNDETPVPARILIVANAFDNAMAWGGLGGRSVPLADVLRAMQQGAGREFDTDVMKALEECERSGSLFVPPSAGA